MSHESAVNEGELTSPSPNYFLGLFTVESWREFKRHGARVMGFNEKKAKAATRLRPGDRILCYLSKVSALVGVLEVTGSSYVDQTPIWSDGVFPVRLPVKILNELPLFLAVPIGALQGKLSFYPSGMTGAAWTGYVRSSPRAWTKSDGAVVVRALEERTGVANDWAREPDPDDATKPALRKFLKLPLTTAVGRLVKRTEDLVKVGPSGLLGSYDSALSGNKVTGYSVNVPIATTCQPTLTCMETCYFAKGAPTWLNALRHQRRVYASMKSDPIAFAARVAMEYDKLGLTFVRWNGGGDLFGESVTAVNHLAKMRPDIVIWIVTRVAKWAAQIKQAPKVFVHFSLDRHSLPRRNNFLRQKPLTSNYFFSYQCDRSEIPAPANLKNIGVLFFHDYKPTTELTSYPKEIVCPLNTAPNIAGVCETCRRCFNGDAVRFNSDS